MAETKQPYFRAYAVEEGRKGQKSFWTPIGRLFEHEDGKGYDLPLNALPVNGRIVIRLDEPRADQPAEA